MKKVKMYLQTFFLNKFYYNEETPRLVIDYVIECIAFQMVLQFEDRTIGCCNNTDTEDFDKFNKKFLKLSKLERKQVHKHIYIIVDY